MAGCKSGATPRARGWILLRVWNSLLRSLHLSLMPARALPQSSTGMWEFMFCIGREFFAVDAFVLYSMPVLRQALLLILRVWIALGGVPWFQSLTYSQFDNRCHRSTDARNVWSLLLVLCLAVDISWYYIQVRQWCLNSGLKRYSLGGLVE